MAVDITAKDVFEMTEQIEKDACAFYQYAAVASNHPKCRQVFSHLASFESDHAQVFCALKEQFSAPGGEFGGSAAEAKEWPLVTSLFASGIREDLTKRFTGGEGPIEIMERAIDFEKDTIVFLASIANMLAPVEKRKVDDIIREELGHIFTLTSELAQLK